ncbi:Hypothetical_protein [Hexamita inflata]|uniref:Hypothetical_protein n=1 Tax=Hexamita inflata TaxID=28002 RepID=A0AA86Q5E3_9EUKA|nr:Hypothetical protein HINF_LOCUS40354 [Hexamita inflata]
MFKTLKEQYRNLNRKCNIKRYLITSLTAHVSLSSYKLKQFQNAISLKYFIGKVTKMDSNQIQKFKQQFNSFLDIQIIYLAKNGVWSKFCIWSVRLKIIIRGGNSFITIVQLWEVELLFLVYYVSNYILKYFATSNADDKFQQIISSWRLFMNYSLTQEGQKYDFDRIRPQSTIQSRYLIFQKGKIEITTCNKRTAMTKINAVEDVQGRSTNSLNKLRQF